MGTSYWRVGAEEERDGAKGGIGLIAGHWDFLVRGSAEISRETILTETMAWNEEETGEPSTGVNEDRALSWEGRFRRGRGRIDGRAIVARAEIPLRIRERIGAVRSGDRDLLGPPITDW